VNVLLALAWPQHEFHAPAHQRLARSGSWATCALTQLSFLRLSSTPALSPAAASISGASAMLALLVSDARHRYVEAMPAPLDARFAMGVDRLQGPGQLADAYLLALARRDGATLLTFDRRMAALASADELEILPAPG